MKQKFHKAKKQGFTLLETVIAMSVLSIGLLGLAAMTIVVKRSENYNENLAAAQEIATEVIDVLDELSQTLMPDGMSGFYSAMLDGSNRCPRITSGSCFFSGDRLNAAECPHNFNVANFDVDCPGPADLGNSRFFWVDGEFELAPLGGFDAKAPISVSDMDKASDFRNTSRPFFVYYIVEDELVDASTGEVTKKGVGVFVGWYSRRFRRLEHIFMSRFMRPN